MASVSNVILPAKAAPAATDSGTVMLSGSAATDASNEFSFAQALAQLQDGAALPISPSLLAATQVAAATDQDSTKDAAANALALLLGNVKMEKGGKGLPTAEQSIQADGKVSPVKLADEAAVVVDPANVVVLPDQLSVNAAAVPVVAEVVSAKTFAPNGVARAGKFTDALTFNMTKSEGEGDGDGTATGAVNVLQANLLANKTATGGSVLPGTDLAAPKFEMSGGAGSGFNTSFSDWLSKADVTGVAARTLGITARATDHEVQPLPTNQTASAPFSLANLDNGGVRSSGNVVVTNIPVPVQSHDWSQAFSEKMTYLVKQDIQGAEIRLNPAHLGPVEVRIAINQDQAHVTLAASQGATREALEAALPKLREMLSDAGLTLASATVSGDSFSDQRGRESTFNMTGDSQQNGNFEGAQQLTEELSPEEQSVAMNSVVSGPKVLDVFA